MTTFTPDTILGDIVTADPATTRVLDRFKIDYCCHGQRSVSDACAESNASVDEVLAALAAKGPGQRPEWADMDDTSLIAHIVSTHHKFLRDELPRMTELTGKVAHVHGANHAELASVRDTFGRFRAEMEPHMRTEETQLFPAISIRAGDASKAVSPELRKHLQQHLDDHDSAGELLHEIRRLTHDYAVPADACASYKAMLTGLDEIETDTHLHVHKENNVLFKRVLASA